MHCLGLVDIKSSDARATSTPSTKRKETVLTTKKQSHGSILALAQVRCINVAVVPILIISQRKRLMVAKANELKRCRAGGQAAIAKAGHQAAQYRNIGSSNSKANQNLIPRISRNIEASAIYIIENSPGKGLGMFATKDIQKGTRILAEKPFFSLSEAPELSLIDPYAPNDISEAFDRLTIDEQSKYMSLHCPERTDCSPLISIHVANCYEMGPGTCICLDASRINHSCIPNAHFSWNDSTKRITVHAVKEIPMGEEVTISYCPAIRTFEGRKSSLKPYVFTCCCPACQMDTEFGRSSRIRRRQMRNLDHEIADFQHDPSAARAEHGNCNEEPAILRLVSLLDDEGLVYEKSRAYHDAAECASKQGLRVKALQYASKELDVDSCCVGKDSPSYKETMDFFLRIYFGGEEILD